MDGVVKLWGKTKKFVQDNLKSNDLPPDERIQNCVNKLVRLETIIRVIQKNFEAYAAAVIATAESSQLISNDIAQFYKAAQQKSRQTTIGQFNQASNKMVALANSLFRDGMRHTDAGVLAEFSKWLGQIDRIKQKAEDAHGLRAQAFEAHHRANAMREKLQRRNDKREIERVLPELEEQAQLQKAQFESLRTNIESSAKRLIAGRGRQLDMCWGRLVQAQIEFFRRGAEMWSKMQPGVTQLCTPSASRESTPRENTPRASAARPAKNGKIPKEKPKPKRTKPPPPKRKPAPASKPGPPATPDRPKQAGKPTIANNDLLFFGDTPTPTPQPAETNSSAPSGVQIQVPPATQPAVNDFLNFDAPSSPLNVEQSVSYNSDEPHMSASGTETLPPPREEPEKPRNSMDALLDFGGSPTVSTPADPTDPLGSVFGSPGAIPRNTSTDTFDVFANGAMSSPSGSREASKRDRLSPPTNSGPVDFMSEPSLSGGGDMFGDFFGGAPQNNAQSNNLFSSSQAQFRAPPQPGPSGPTGMSLGDDISQGFRVNLGSADLRAIRSDTGAQARINAAVRRKAQEYDAQMAEEESKCRNIEEARYRLREKLDTWQKRNGVERDIRSLISNLHTILWPGAKWKRVGLADLTGAAKVKRGYRKAILLIHPDRHNEDPIEVQVTCERAFEAINDAWKRFSNR